MAEADQRLPISQIESSSAIRFLQSFPLSQLLETLPWLEVLVGAKKLSFLPYQRREDLNKGEIVARLISHQEN